jgi:hypothetical protein
MVATKRIISCFVRFCQEKSAGLKPNLAAEKIFRSGPFFDDNFHQSGAEPKVAGGNSTLSYYDRLPP